MAQSVLIPKNGAVVAAGLTADYNSFDIESSQATEVITPYGTNTCSKSAGSGTPQFTVTVNAFALAHATGTAPNMPGLVATGATATFTLDTGVSEAGTFITEKIRISHGRMKAAVPITLNLVNAGDVTETWATA